MRFIIAAALLVLLPSLGNAAEVITGTTILRWVAPTQNVDGSPITDLAAFTIYAGTASRDYDQSHQVNDPTATTATFTVALSLSPGANDVFIAMTASDADGNESAYSNEIKQTVVVTDDVPPDSPNLITITITVDVADCLPGHTCTVEVNP